MTTRPTSQAHLARLLGISPAAVTALKQRGMPTHDLDAARHWREVNLHPMYRKGVRMPPIGGREPRQADLVEAAEVLNARMRDAYPDKAACEALAPAMRAAMRAVPHHRRHEVRPFLATWIALLGYEPPFEVRGDEEFLTGDKDWYEIAAGEVSDA